MRILMTVSLFLSFSTSLADIGEVAKQLNAIVIENEANTRSIEDERIKASDEKVILDAKIKELEAQKEKATKAVELKVDSDTLNSILLAAPVGHCVIKQGQHEREYIITGSDKTTIRFVFAPFDSALTPVAQHIKSENGFSAIEISQKKFTPERIDNAGEMNAVIRFESETLSVKHATFRGQKINDKWGGYSSSYATYQLTCIL